MGSMFEQRLSAIAWDDFRTTYGPAINLPDQLRRLAGPDREAAMDASYQLWYGLCHQHVQLESAALPALPFLLEVLDRADRDMTVELLDLLLGFALGVDRQRAADFQLSLGGKNSPDEWWVAELRGALLAEVPRLRRLAASPDDEVADLASRTLIQLSTSLSSAGERLSETIGEWPFPFSPIEDSRSKSVFESELRRELKPGHPLFGLPVAALGRRFDQDDFLFALLDGSGRVAGVHLTFAGDREKGKRLFRAVHD